MKQRRLPEIDLANIAPRSSDEKRKALLPFSLGGGGWSYDPSRKRVLDVTDCGAPLDIEPRKSTLTQIERDIRRTCTHGEEQVKANIEVTRLLHKWSKENLERAVSFHIPALGFGHLGSVDYCYNFLGRYRGDDCIFAFDHRRGKGYSVHGRQFAFSMMHEQARVAFPELASAKLVIVQFPALPNLGRQIRLFDDTGIELFSFEQLSQMINDTYAIWGDILREKAESQREEERRTGTSGTLI